MRQSQPPQGGLSLSVFFPCHNEAANIEPLARKTAQVLEALTADWEIIIVDDGSTDATAAIAEALSASEPRIRAVHHPRNLGYGMALRSGFAAAGKQYVFYTDGDGQFDVSELPSLLREIPAADIVSGYRRRRRDGLRRRIMGACWSRLVQGMLKFRCRDVDSAFKLYRREIFERIRMKSTGALIDAEVLARASRLGYTIRTVPVSHLPRQAGKASGSRLGVILRAFKELLALRKDILSCPPKACNGRQQSP